MAKKLNLTPTARAFYEALLSVDLSSIPMDAPRLDAEGDVIDDGITSREFSLSEDLASALVQYADGKDGRIDLPVLFYGLGSRLS